MSEMQKVLLNNRNARDVERVGDESEKSTVTFASRIQRVT